MVFDPFRVYFCVWSRLGFGSAAWGAESGTSSSRVWGQMLTAPLTGTLQGTRNCPVSMHLCVSAVRELKVSATQCWKEPGRSQRSVVAFLDRASQKPAKGAYPRTVPFAGTSLKELSGQVCKVMYDKDSQQLFVIVEI